MGEGTWGTSVDPNIRGYIGTMEKKMETTIMGLYRVEGLGLRV